MTGMTLAFAFPMHWEKQTDFKEILQNYPDNSTKIFPNY